MTTALQIVSRAAELIGYKDPGEPLSGTDAEGFLDVLNSLLGTWNTQRLYVPATQEVSASVSASPVSIGTSQTLDTPRPVRIEDAWVRIGGVDHLLSPICRQEYDAIPDKSTASTIPNEYFYSPDLPHGAMYLYPVPSEAVDLHVRVMTQLTEFADISTDYNLAAGYKRALEYSVAEELGPSHGEPSRMAQVARMAINARRAIKLANFEPLKLSIAGQSFFNIQTGE